MIEDSGEVFSRQSGKLETLFFKLCGIMLVAEVIFILLVGPFVPDDADLSVIVLSSSLAGIVSSLSITLGRKRARVQASHSKKRLRPLEV